MIISIWGKNLLKTFCVYLQAKQLTSSPYFFEDWLSVFWPITRGLEILEIWYWWWNINNNFSFRFRLFPRKTDDKIFQNIQKHGLWAFFAQIWSKNHIVQKRALPVFKYSNYLPSCQKSEKKLMSHSWEKCWTDWWVDRQIDRQTDRQTDNGDYIGPSTT